MSNLSYFPIELVVAAHESTDILITFSSPVAP